MAAICDTFKFNADEVWRMPVMDYFSYISYINAERKLENRRQQAELAKMRRR